MFLCVACQLKRVRLLSHRGSLCKKSTNTCATNTERKILHICSQQNMMYSHSPVIKCCDIYCWIDYFITKCVCVYVWVWTSLKEQIAEEGYQVRVQQIVRGWYITDIPAHDGSWHHGVTTLFMLLSVYRLAWWSSDLKWTLFLALSYN